MMSASQPEMSAARAAAQRKGPSPSREKFLSFRLGEQEFGLDILSVQEIIGLLPITTIPRSPRFLLGVVNLRGKVIPVIDLNGVFECRPEESGKPNCIVVAETDIGLIGLLVDSVSEVAEAEEDELRTMNQLGLAQSCFLGVNVSDSAARLLLDIEELTRIAFGDKTADDMAAA